MNCPKCDEKMKVMETRTENYITYRRYVCHCGNMEYTREAISDNAKMKISRIRIRMDKHSD